MTNHRNSNVCFRHRWTIFFFEIRQVDVMNSWSNYFEKHNKNVSFCISHKHKLLFLLCLASLAQKLLSNTLTFLLCASIDWHYEQKSPQMIFRFEIETTKAFVFIVTWFVTRLFRLSFFFVRDWKTFFNWTFWFFVSEFEWKIQEKKNVFHFYEIDRFYETFRSLKNLNVNWFFLLTFLFKWYFIARRFPSFICWTWFTGCIVTIFSISYSWFIRYQ